jgi:hypothetical protein
MISIPSTKIITEFPITAFIDSVNPIILVKTIIKYKTVKEKFHIQPL